MISTGTHQIIGPTIHASSSASFPSAIRFTLKRIVRAIHQWASLNVYQFGKLRRNSVVHSLCIIVCSEMHLRSPISDKKKRVNSFTMTHAEHFTGWMHRSDCFQCFRKAKYLSLMNLHCNFQNLKSKCYLQRSCQIRFHILHWNRLTAHTLQPFANGSLPLAKCLNIFITRSASNDLG